MLSRAQTVSEFLLITVFLIVLVGSLMLQSANESEISLAIAGARLGCLEYSSVVNSSQYCTSINYSKVEANLTIMPHLYDMTGTRISNPQPVFQAYLISGIAGNILNNHSFACNNCNSCLIGHYNYCINASA